ncbi:hypothetical protein EIP91_000828 [Steccherinum ochraceum]|uniref:Uncharacterized protein n=1 Tax=Steccherinum ochraceum TaxID=92696 RepID=A0A4R0RUQ7_9APHY|nr:hypothetical protein EIP91_000828 [Steccherinum ochraceum]
MPRKVTQEILSSPEQEDVGIEEMEEDEVGSEDNSMLEMISMLKEFQKRKATKNSTRTNLFQNKKQAMYTEARKNADAVVLEGVAYVEHYKKTIMELKASELSAEVQLQGILATVTTLDDHVQAALSLYPSMFDVLSHKRAAEINDACELIEKHGRDLHLSRRRLIREAKTKVEDQLESQRVATDASDLIRHYKSLLLSRS